MSEIAQSEIDALKKLAEKKCNSAPRLVNYKIEQQDDDSVFVPRGFLIYILMTKCPGRPLITMRGRESMDVFHHLDLAEREDIRRAFEVAYKYVLHYLNKLI